MSFFHLFNKKYYSTNSLADYQSSIIKQQDINIRQAQKYLKELKRYKLLVENNYFGLNPVAVNNLAIRYYMILSTLYFKLNKSSKSYLLRSKADTLFANLCQTFYIEGFSYFLYVKSAYDFYFKITGTFDNSLMKTVLESYQKIAAPDKTIPTTDTAFTSRITDSNPVVFGNEQNFRMYSVYNISDKIYVFVNHYEQFRNHSHIGHINFEFGHFCIYSNGWKVLHKWYPGYKAKQESDIKEVWNENVIIKGLRTKEPFWRILRPKVKYDFNDDQEHYFKYARTSRCIKVSDDSVTVTDKGGEYSSFNISDDCKYTIVEGKFETRVGYHSPEQDKIDGHRRLELTGRKRKIIFHL